MNVTLQSETESAEANPRSSLRWMLAALTTLTTAVGVALYWSAMRTGGVNVLELASVPLFIVLFGWVAFSFWTATTGLASILTTRSLHCAHVESDPDAPLPPTAILMPIYNENPAAVFAGIQAMAQSLQETGHEESFDFFVLSDTTDPDIWLEEERAWAWLVAQQSGRPSVFYRRRPKNTSRKSGNIADFCTRWGSQYRFMVVLDADSVMEGATIVEMARRMDADPQLGILQVPPTPVNRMSLFARLQQFAARLYGPVCIHGFASWARFDSNYWGHNAIIRVEPFIRHCTLPVLPGKGPLGGEILSHDFVEAALMSRAGYKVCLASDLGGSYEECPTTLLDYAKRDQRWLQGNLQHTRLILSQGFRPISRLHLTMGVMAYLTSPLWLFFMILSASAMLLESSPSATQQGWPGGGAATFALTMTLLLLPKVWGVIALVKQPERIAASGGWRAILSSVALETLISVLIAPVMMFFHTRFVIATLLGEKVHWSAQNRGEGAMGLGESLVAYGSHTLLGIAAAVLVALAAPSLLVWFSPIVVGLILAAPLSMVLASVAIGQKLACRGLLLIPEETAAPALLDVQKRAIDAWHRHCANFDRSQLFDAVLHDPTFHSLHRDILRATDGHVAAPKEQLRQIVELIEREGPSAAPPQARTAVLSDINALRYLHVKLRSQYRPPRSALAN